MSPGEAMSLLKTHFPAATQLVPLSLLAEIEMNAEWDFQEGPLSLPMGCEYNGWCFSSYFGP